MSSVGRALPLLLSLTCVTPERGQSVAPVAAPAASPAASEPLAAWDPDQCRTAPAPWVEEFRNGRSRARVAQKVPSEAEVRAQACRTRYALHAFPGRDGPRRARA